MEEKTVTLQIRMTPALKQKLEEYAQGKGMTKLTRLTWIAIAAKVAEDDQELSSEVLAQM